MNLPTYKYKSVIVIGDVHGQYNKLKSLLDQLPKDVAICFVGDIIDRGPENRKCIEIAKQHLCTLGNHEQMMLHFYEDKLDIASWKGNGGDTTLAEYKDKISFNNDIVWIKTLPVGIRFEFENDKSLIVSHADISLFMEGKFDGEFNYEEISDKFEIDKEHIDDYIIWNRLHKRHLYDAYNNFYIFGHTISDNFIIDSHKLCIDNGAFIDDRELIAFQYPEKVFYSS